MSPGIINAWIILYAALFGFGFVVMKHLVAFLDVRVIVLFRVLITFVFLVPFAWKKWPNVRIQKSHVVRLVLGAFSGVVLCQSLFVYGLGKTSASHASVIFGLIPILTLFYAKLFRAEKVLLRRVFGFLISLIGIAYLMEVEKFSWGSSTHVGDLIIFINANGVAFYLVVVRPLSRYYSSLWVTACMFFMGLICIIPFSVNPLLIQAWSSLPLSAWLSLLYVTLGATLSTYLLGVWLLRFTSSSHVSQSVYLQTLLAIGAAAWFLGEPLSNRLFISTVLVFLGLAVSQDVLWKSFRRKPKAAL